jgi:hypothetical protein
VVGNGLGDRVVVFSIFIGPSRWENHAVEFCSLFDFSENRRCDYLGKFGKRLMKMISFGK